MHKPERNCPELTRETASAIDDKSLHHLFISSQMNNVDLCVECALRWESNYIKFHNLTVFRQFFDIDETNTWIPVIHMVFKAFPHFWVTQT